MDRIIVRKNADMQRVLDWSEVLRGMAVELPFSDGEIEFQEEWILLKFRDRGDGVVDFEFWIHTDTNPDWGKVCDFGWNFVTDKMANLRIAGKLEQKMSLGNVLIEDNTIAKLVGKFRAIMLFATYYREEVVRTKVVTRSVAGNGKSGKRSNRRMLTMRKYTIGADMLSELPAPKKEWHGYAESFGVRGHYRHYKDGKVVWVRPFTKKGRNEKKSDREYIL